MMNVEKLDNRDFNQPDIEWDYHFVEVYETDLDGHGTQEGLIEGRMTEGKEWTDYTAIAQATLPYDKDCFTIEDGSIEVVDCGTYYQED